MRRVDVACLDVGACPGQAITAGVIRAGKRADADPQCQPGSEFGVVRGDGE